MKFHEMSQNLSWWARDFWYTALILKRRWPGLVFIAYNAPPTGLVSRTNLDPGSRTLEQHYHATAAEMKMMTLAGIGVEALHAGLEVWPTSDFASHSAISKVLWL